MYLNKPYKRLDLLVRMIRALGRQLPYVRLNIAGLGGAAPAIQAHMHKLGLQDHGAVYGVVDESKRGGSLSDGDLSRAFHARRLQPSWYRGHGHGCPAVAFGVPGVSASVRHGDTSLLTQENVYFCRARTFFSRKGELRRYSEALRAWAETCSRNSSYARQTLRTLLRAGLARETCEKSGLEPAP